MSLDVYIDIDVCKCCKKGETVYEANITHNLNTMAEAAGIYNHLWRPDEINIKHACELIDPLKDGLKKLKRAPVKYSKFNPKNNWGSYEGLVSFVEKYIKACEIHPSGEIIVSR